MVWEYKQVDDLPDGNMDGIDTCNSKVTCVLPFSLFPQSQVESLDSSNLFHLVKGNGRTH